MGLVIILLFIFTASMNRKISTTAPIRINQQEIVLRSIELPKEKIIEIVKPKEIIKRQPVVKVAVVSYTTCLLYTSPSPRDRPRSRMPSSA